MKKTEMKTCKTCTHFKCCQIELNYWESTGFCTNDSFRFNINNGRLVGVYDKGNLKNVKEKTGNPSHDIETRSITPVSLIESRYILQVSEDFGCIYHKDKK